jgi:hypothetical protein
MMMTNKIMETVSSLESEDSNAEIIFLSKKATNNLFRDDEFDCNEA